MSITPLQAEIITKMKSGNTLSHSRYIGYSAISFNEISSFVHKGSVNALRRKKLIEFDKKISHSTFTYKLTDLDKKESEKLIQS